MAIFIVENNGKISYGIKRYVCKTMADIPVEVNGEEIAPGSKVYVSDEKKTYMLNTAGQWVEIKEGGGASALSDLADVDISGTIQGGKVLKYNAVEEKWVPGDDSGNVQSDWNENDPTSGAFILNKPDISNIISGTANPSVNIGNDGDIYLKKELVDSQEQMDINYFHAYDGLTTTITISQNNTVIYTNTVNNVQQGDLDERYAGFDEVTANVTSLGGIPFIFKYRGVAVNDNYPLCFFTSFNDGEETGWRMGGGNSSFARDETRTFNVPSGFIVSEIFLKDNDEWIVYKQDQVQSDWNESDITDPAYIQNKPTIPAAQIQSDWNESDTTSKAYIQNKPTIPAAITELDDIPDVDITDPEDGQVLSYDATSDKWVAGAPGSSGVELTQAEYDALTPEEQTNGTEYFITDGTNATVEAASILYDNEDSGLFASDVQNAIDELNYNISNLGSDLEDLEDVNITNIQDGQIIKYDATSQTWVNADDEGGTELPVPTTADIGKSLVVESDGQGGTQYAYDINSCVELTQAEYDILTTEEKNNGSIYQISDKGYFYYKEKKFHQVKELTMAEYNQLTPTEQNNGVEYFITDAPEIVTEITLADYEELTLEEQMNGTIYQIIDCGYFFYKGNRFMASLELTLAEYNQLTLEEQMNGTEYFITDAPEMVTDLTQVEYDALTTEQKNNGSIYQISNKGYFYYKEKQFRATKELTQAQYDTLTPEQKADGTIYMISDATNNLGDLDNVSITTPVDGQILVYDDSSNEWVNSAVTTNTINEVDTVGTLPSVSYNANTYVLTFDAGTLPTTSSTTVITSVTSNSEVESN